MVHRNYAHGEAIWGEQDEAQTFAIVVSGIVKLTKMLADGRQQIVGLMFPGSCLGRAYSDTQHSFAEAATDIELCCFPRRQFEQVMEEHPKLEHALLEQTLLDLDEAHEWMLALGRKSAGEKMASFLLQMMHKSEQTKCPHVRPQPELPIFGLPLTRGEIADYLGLTLETVSRNFSKLRAAGIINLIDGQTVEICDADALEDLSESEAG